MTRLPAWHVHPDVLLVIGGIGLLYVRAVRARTRVLPRGAEPPTTRRQRWLFGLGLGSLLLGAGWPVHDLGESYLYSIHMVQHLLFSLVAAPLLLAGMPAWMLRALLRPRWAFATVRFLTRPLMALIVFNGTMLFIHWPAVVDLSVRSEAAHLALHLLIVGSGLVMWWPVLSPLPEMPALSRPLQLAYLFGQSILPTIPASFLTFGETPLYPIYASFPRIWGVSALTDQLVAGLLMKLGGGVIIWAVMAVVFFRWFEQERNEGWDALRFSDVDRDVRSGLARR